MDASRIAVRLAVAGVIASVPTYREKALCKSLQPTSVPATGAKVNSIRKRDVRNVEAPKILATTSHGFNLSEHHHNDVQQEEAKPFQGIRTEPGPGLRHVKASERNKKPMYFEMGRRHEDDEVLGHSKRHAAMKAVDDFVKNGMTVGMGTGTTMFHAIEHLGSKLRNNELQVRSRPPC
jgi:hypothetical protein